MVLGLEGAEGGRKDDEGGGTHLRFGVTKLVLGCSREIHVLLSISHYHAPWRDDKDHRNELRTYVRTYDIY